MTRKYQEGGQLTDTQQQGLQYLAQMYAQQTGKDPQQDQEGFMQFIQQLAQQAGVQDIGQLLDMVYQQAQGQAQAAKRGAKLNYLKRLTGKCPEGYELQYFRAGGRVCSHCKKVQTNKCGNKVKKNCGGKKIKFQNGDKMEIINLEDPKYGGVENPFFRPSEKLRGYWLYPGVTVTSKKGKPYNFDRRVSDIGGGRSVISESIHNQYIPGTNKYLGDITGIVGNRTIYTSPNGNDTIYGPRAMGPLGEWNGEGYNLMEFPHGFMDVPKDAKDQRSRKNNFYESMRKTRRPNVPNNTNDPYYNEYVEEQNAYNRARQRK